MNQPVGLSSGRASEAVKIMHALIEGDVRIRDDRGTPMVLADDMNIGPMTHLEFDEATQQITTDSHVDMVGHRPDTIGDGLLIQLRKPEFEARPAQDVVGRFGGVEFASSRRISGSCCGPWAIGDVPRLGPEGGDGPQEVREGEAVDVVASTTVKDAAEKEPSPPRTKSRSRVGPGQGPMRIDCHPTAYRSRKGRPSHRPPGGSELSGTVALTIRSGDSPTSSTATR